MLFKKNPKTAVIKKIKNGHNNRAATQRANPPRKDGSFIAPDSTGKLMLVRPYKNASVTPVTQTGAILETWSNKTDSGQVSAYEPSLYINPRTAPFFQRIKAAWSLVTGHYNPSKTTQQGALSAASPTTYGFALWQQRYERQLLIADCNELYRSDPRTFRAVNMYCNEATRGGVKIIVDGTDANSKKAQELGVELCTKLISKAKICGWAKMLLVEGDLFIQAIFEDKTLVDARRMPAASMERLTDDSDQFTDPMRAYAQVDVLSQQDVTIFPSGAICHVRWNYLDGERYGYPEIAPGRRMNHVLSILEEAQAVRRLTNSGKKILFNIGTESKPGLPSDVQEFKNINGFADGQAQSFDPMESTRSYFGNGLVSVSGIQSDANISKIEDITHYQEVYTASLPTPPIMYGITTNSATAQIIEHQKEQWLKSTSTLNDSLEQAIIFLYEMQLLLAGIDPDSISYKIFWTKSSMQTTRETIDWVCDLHTNGMLGRETGIALISEFTGVQNIAREIESIDNERKEIKNESVHYHVLEQQELAKIVPDTEGETGPNGQLIENKMKTRGSQKRTTPELKNRYGKGGRPQANPLDPTKAAGGKVPQGLYE